MPAASLDAAGVVFTASHNPAQYNGMKMAKPGAVPVSSDTGLFDIRDRAAELPGHGIPAPAPKRAPSPKPTCSPAMPATCAPWWT